MNGRARLLCSLLGASLLGAAVADELRDPTRPPSAPVLIKQARERVLLPRVSAIFVSSARRVAIFDDQPVREGDVVGAYRIEAITATGVRYSHTGHAGPVAFAPLVTAAEAPPSP